MKKNTYFIIPFAGLLAALIIGLGASFSWKSSAQRPSRQSDQEDLSYRKQNYETYKPSNILQLDYGDGDKQVGLTSGMEDFRAMGPLSFAVKGEDIYILDEVNGRAKVFTRSGELQRSVPVSQGSFDIAVDDSDRLYVLDGKMNSVAEYEFGSYSSKKLTVSQTLSGLNTDSESAVSAKMLDSSNYSLDDSGGKLTLRSSQQSYTCMKVGDYMGKVIDNSTGRGFKVSTENLLGSISYLGKDWSQNIYVVVEELLPGDTIQVKKEVRKYAPDGRQVAEIPINIDYAAHPEKELLLGGDGSIYHLLPMKEHLIVEKWSKQ